MLLPGVQTTNTKTGCHRRANLASDQLADHDAEGWDVHGSVIGASLPGMLGVLGGCGDETEGL